MVTNFRCFFTVFAISLSCFSTSALAIKSNVNSTANSAINPTEEVEVVVSHQQQPSQQNYQQYTEPNTRRKAVTQLAKQSRNTDDLYMVILADAPLATYQGGIANLTATSIVTNAKNKRANRARLNIHSSTSKRYLQYLQQKRGSLLTTLANKMRKTITIEHEFSYALNGFTSRMTKTDAEILAKQTGIKKVVKITPQYLTSDAGPQFIQAPNVWQGITTTEQSFGEGIIVGILDSGIVPQHPSFAEVGGDGYVHANPLGNGNYLGDCAKSEFAHYCNNKLIGIWSHPEITSQHTPFGDDRIGFDHDGHGTHVASIAAGNIVKNVPFINVIGDEAQYHAAQISGVAPHANIIAYQVCAADFGCWPDITALAIEHAIEHGVDVLNYSVGGDSSDPWNSVDALAFLSAREAGIHVAVSAGNEGPELESLSSPGNAPWLTSVAAVDHGREYSDKSISFSGGNTVIGSFSGVGITDGISGNIVYAGHFGDKNCLTPFASGTFTGKIVVCVRNDIPRVEKGRNVLAGGAIGLVLINDPNTPATDNLVADLHVLPAIQINNANGQRLVTWLNSGTNHQATISGTEQQTNSQLADVVANFSSRGPDLQYKQWLVPSLAAPGVDIYAANSDYQPHYSSDKKNESNYTFNSGTSMASPNVAGALALISDIHPDWTPAQAQSALMLSAEFSTKKIVNEQLVTADFLDAGAGSLRIDKAINSGLLMDIATADYEQANPLNQGEPATLNLPSLMNENCRISCRWQRTFTATATSSWQASYQYLTSGLTIKVSPESFQLTKGQSITLTFTGEISAGFNSDYGMGRVILTPSNNTLSVAAIPLVGQFIAGDYPDDIEIMAHADQGSAAINGLTSIGTDDLSIQVHGLSVLNTQSITIARDGIDNAQWPENIYNDNSFYYSQAVVVPAGTKYFSFNINATSSPDLDVYIGLDTNGNGRPNSVNEINNAICQSATATALEKCAIINPPAGNYFIAIHNYGDNSVASSAIDTVTFDWAIIGENNNQLSVTYSPLAFDKQAIDLTLNWFPPLLHNQYYLTVLEVGTSIDTPDNIGYIPVKLYRSGRFVSANIDKTAITAGDNFSLSLVLDGNTATVEKTTTITVSLPENSTKVADSHNGVLGSNNITWQVTQMPLSAAQTITATFTSNADLASGNVNISYSYLEGGSQVSYLINQLSITAKANNTSTGTTSSAGGNASGSSGGSFDFICLLILLMFNRTINVNKVK